MAPRLLRLAALTTILVLLLAGCTAPPASQGELWAPAASSHPGSLALTSSDLRLEGVRAAAPLREVELVAEKLPGPNSEWIAGSNPPAQLVIRGAMVDGTRGALVVTFGQGVTLRALSGTFGDPAFDLVVRSGEDRLEPATEDIEGAYPDGLTSGVPFGNVEIGLPLPSSMGVTAERLVLVPEDGGERVELGSSATVADATDILAFGGTGFYVEVPAGGLVWRDRLGVVANSARGTATLAGEEHDVRGQVFAVMEGRGGDLAWTTEGEERSFRASGELQRLREAGGERIGATVAALPEVMEIAGPAGKVAKFNIALVERSGGAMAVPTGFEVVQVGSTPAPTLELARADPLPVTRELLALANETAEEGLVAVPAVLAIGIAAPLVGFAESFAEIFRAFSTPTLGTIQANGATSAQFAVEVPANSTSADLVIHFANAPDVRVYLTLTPEAA